MKKEKKNHVKMPRFRCLVWFRGVVDGKKGAAALDEMQIVQSGEVQMYQKRFQTFVGKQIVALDQELHVLSAESEKLIYELNRLEEIAIPESKPLSEGAGALEQRAAARRSAEIDRIKSERKTKREANVKRLIDIRTAFSDKEASCQESLMAVAAAVEEVLGVYCKGVLHKRPLIEQNIPTVNIDGAIQAFHQQIQWTYRAIMRIDKEVLQYHENQ